MRARWWGWCRHSRCLSWGTEGWIAARGRWPAAAAGLPLARPRWGWPPLGRRSQGQGGSRACGGSGGRGGRALPPPTCCCSCGRRRAAGGKLNRGFTGVAASRVCARACCWLCGLGEVVAWEGGEGGRGGGWSQHKHSIAATQPTGKHTPADIPRTQASTAAHTGTQLNLKLPPGPSTLYHSSSARRPLTRRTGPTGRPPPAACW